VPDPSDVEAIVEQIRPLLAGHDAAIQGAVLADLLAMWLAGHVGESAEQAREILLHNNIEMVRKLIPVNAG
jgi:hypothetical protein